MAGGATPSLRSRLSTLVATENRKIAVVVVLWAIAIASTFAQALYARAYLTTVDYALAFAICLLAGVIVIDLGKAILSFVAAMLLSMVVLLGMLTIPATLYGNLPPPGDIIIGTLWITIVFYAVFPFPMMGLLIATVIGSVIGERYF